MFINYIHLIDTGAGPDDDLGMGSGAEAPAAATGGKYVPPSMRGAGGARAAGESMRGAGGNRDDLPTLRVTNISEDTQENDLRELFGVFGRVARVYVGRDRETGAGKGFAFVSFEDRANAQKAIDKVHGRGYDNLILSVQWSREFSPANTSFFIMTIFFQNHDRTEDDSRTWFFCFLSFCRIFLLNITSCTNLNLDRFRVFGISKSGGLPTKLNCF